MHNDAVTALTKSGLASGIKRTDNYNAEFAGYIRMYAELSPQTVGESGWRPSTHYRPALSLTAGLTYIAHTGVFTRVQSQQQ